MSSFATSPKRLRRWLMLLAAFSATLLVLFAWNGLSSSWREPEYEELTAEPSRVTKELRVLSLNLAKANFHRGLIDFASRAELRARLDRVAELIRTTDAELVFLSEVVWESGPIAFNQARYLAEQTGMHALAYGDNYRFGLPFMRIRAGNAVLSKLPMEALAVHQLAGATPFYAPTGNRRVLWCRVRVATEDVLIASVRNDSFDLQNNSVQVQELLNQLDDGPVLLAGDFNAEPHDPGIRLLAGEGRFAEVLLGQPTYPARAPSRQIDYIFAPEHWERIRQEALASGASDHLAVFAVYRLALKERSAPPR